MVTERDDLDDLLGSARDDGPSADLVARVLADAETVQSTPEPMAKRPQTGWLSGLLSAIGGWGAASGITAAGVMGLAVGLYAPDSVATWLGSDVFLGSDVSVTPNISTLWVEDGDV